MWCGPDKGLEEHAGPSMHSASHPEQTWPHEETTKHRMRGAGGLETVDKALGTDG